MIELRKREACARWLDGLRDQRGREHVLLRVERLAARNPGDARPVGEGTSELRIGYGPGYRVCYKMRCHAIISLLAGGSKRTQVRTSRRLAVSHEICKWIS